MEHPRRSWDDRGRITLQDVADEAGVSQSAASVVLNGARSGTGVSAEKRARVLAAAERLGYRPNGIARALSTGRTNRIGVYAHRFELNSRNQFFADVLGGIFKGASDLGMSTTVHTAGTGEEALMDLVSNRSIDGLILQVGVHDPIRRFLGELRMPAVVIVDRMDTLASVVVDDRAGGELLAQHFASLGHRHVLLRKSGDGERSAVDRVESFEAAARRLGVRVTSSLTPAGDRSGVDTSDLRVLTEGSDRATAVVAWCDFIAERCCSRLMELGISVPRSIAVAGFDGFEYPSATVFRLTTIRAPWFRVAREATKVLGALLRGETVPSVTTIPVEFFRGNTT